MMAKETLTREGKFKRLVYLVGEPAPHVIGHLELLWHSGWAALSPLLRDSIDVEAAAEWDGEPGKLTAALVECRFLDPYGDGYVIHGFWNHAPWSVKQRADRAGIKWREELERSPDGDRPDADRTPDGDQPETERSPDGVPPVLSCPDQTCPDQTCNPESSSEEPDEPVEDDGFDDFWSLYPRKANKKRAMVSWANLTKKNRELAMSVLPDHIAYWVRERRTKETTPLPTTWINGERWNDEIEVYHPGVHDEDPELVVDVYRRSDLEAHGDEIAWDEYIEAATDHTEENGPRTALTFIDWIEHIGRESE